jgi:hypothetical protein
MMRRAVALAVVAAIPAVLPRSPQQAHGCTVHVDSTHGDTRFGNENGMRTVFSGGGVWARCLGQPTTIYGDSMAFFEASNTLQFVGRVKFRDSTGTLDADKVTYWSRIEHLYAEGNVFTRNLASGTEMRGPNMDLYRVAPGVRDTQEVLANGRPTIRLMPADTTRADTTNPFIIIADRVYLKHTDRMWGSGHVILHRIDMDAFSDSASINLRDSIGYLIGSPVIDGYDTTRFKAAQLPLFHVDTVRQGRRVRLDTIRLVQIDPRPDSQVQYKLTGQRVRFNLTHGQQVRRVVSMGMADALGPDWHLTSDTLDMAVDSGKIQRAQAWGRERRGTAISGLNTVLADSLDIQMPGQVMRQVWAYRGARASSKADSTWPENDWLAGDSLHATFAESDSAGRRRSTLDDVIAFGTARAYYHTVNQQDSSGAMGISYSRGDKINIAMQDGKVHTVDIVGKVDGVYLEPLLPGDTIADSLKTDSLQADSVAGERRGPGAGARDPGTTAPTPTPVPPPAPSSPHPGPQIPGPGPRRPGARGMR